MKEKIMEQAKVLSGMIAQSEEFQRACQTDADLANDPVAYELVNEFQSLHRRLDEERQNGKELSQEDKELYEVMRNKVHSNSTVQAFISAQEGFHRLMEAVQFEIVQGVEVSNSSCDETCCDGCSGCGH